MHGHDNLRAANQAYLLGKVEPFENADLKAVCCQQLLQLEFVGDFAMGSYFPRNIDAAR